MRKPIVRLALKKKSNSELGDFAGTVVDSITGNANFATPSPALADVTTAQDEFVTAVTDYGTTGNRGSHEEHLIVVAKRQVLSTLLNALAGYVQSIADQALTMEEAATIIASAGMEIKNPPTPLGPLPAPQDVRKILSASIPAGDAAIRWNKVNGAGSYIVRRSADGGDTWTVAGYANRSRFQESGLDSGAAYSYTVTAVGAAGEGVESNPCVVRAY